MALLALLAAVAAFGLAFLISHHGAPKPVAAKVVDATIKPGPPSATLKKAFVSASIKPLIEPKVKPKKPKATTSSSTPAPAVAETPAPAVESEPAPTYTPPAATPAPAKKKAPSGGGVITIG